MAMVTAVIVVAGFGPTYAMSAPHGLPLWVHLHGAVMVAWISLFVVQTQLVGRARFALHKQLGWWSTGLVALIVPLGLATTSLAVHRHATPPFFTDAGMMGADLVDLLAFAGLFTAAVLLRRDPAWHKRLLLCATVLLTWPAFGRLCAMAGLPMTSVLGVAAMLMLGLALVGPIHDAVTVRRVHPAYLIGVAVLALTQPLHAVVAASGPMQVWAQRMAG